MKLGMTQKQAFEAQQAVDTSALNGVVYIATLLHRQGLVTREEAVHLYEVMGRPLGVRENAGNPLVQVTHQHLDEQFSAILKQPPKADAVSQ